MRLRKHLLRGKRRKKNVAVTEIKTCVQLDLRKSAEKPSSDGDWI